jgi:GNAT superfamily N-acetyltransferase
VTIREFVSGDEAAFRRLNEEWLLRYFGSLEAKDEQIVSDPRRSILEGGGRIFLAICGGEAVGCCALVRTGSGEYEVAKMAVTESAKGGGIGRLLLEAVIGAARAAGAPILRLETNQKLTPAIRLYESAGFQHVPPERFAPSPYTRCNVQMELHL